MSSDEVLQAAMTLPLADRVIFADGCSRTNTRMKIVYHPILFITFPVRQRADEVKDEVKDEGADQEWCCSTASLRKQNVFQSS